MSVVFVAIMYMLQHELIVIRYFVCFSLVDPIIILQSIIPY